MKSGLERPNAVFPTTPTPNKGAKLFAGELIPVHLPPALQDAGSDNPLHYFHQFLNAGYFFFYIPFKITYFKTGKYYTPLSTPFHKLMCVMVQILSAIRFGLSIRQIVESYSEPNPVLYFELSRSCLTFVYMLAFKWTFWKNQTLFLSIINELHFMRPRDPIRPFKQFRLKWVARFICFLYSITAVLTVFVGFGVIEIVRWEGGVVLEGYAGLARHALLLQGNRDPYPLTHYYDYLLTFLYITMNFYYFLGGHFFDLTVLMGALTLRHLAQQFQKSVHRINDAHHVKILVDEYVKLKGLSCKVNGAIGFVTLWFVIEALPYYATHLDDLLTLSNGYGQFRYLFYVFNFFSILIIASDIAIKVDSFRTWLWNGDRALLLPTSKLLVLLNELATQPIALKAGGIFPITYAFIGTMVSLVITYAVIILQFNHGRCNQPPSPRSLPIVPASYSTLPPNYLQPYFL